MRFCSRITVLPSAILVGLAVLAASAFAGCSATDAGSRGSAAEGPNGPTDDPSMMGPGDPNDPINGGGGASAGPNGPGVVPVGAGGSDVLGPGNPGPTPVAGPDPVGPATPPPAAAGATECLNPELIGPTPIRRISGAEYTNAVRDVFQAVINPGQLPADEKLGIFQANVATRLTGDHFERYRSLANSVSADVVANFPALSGCASSADAACVAGFLDGAARRMFHGTLEPTDSAYVQDVYTELAASTDGDTALQSAVQFILLSPRFLFLVEFGGAGTATRVPLSGSEVAGRLAAFFWRTVPDADLLAAADAGMLSTAEGVRARADRMLTDQRSMAMLESFGEQLLRIVPPGPDADALEQQKKAQVGEIFAKAATDTTLTFDSLIVGDHPPSGSELAGFYGTEDRRGILLTAGFLASNSTGDLPSPVKRGNMVRSALLCGVVPPPSDPTDMQLTDNDTGGTVQETFNAHSDNPTCWSCHKLMDPIGDAFGQYGADGEFDPALTTDTSGTTTPTADGTVGAGDFADLNGFLTLLSQDDEARQCFVLQASRFALGRNETVSDACGVEEVTDAFAASSYSVRELFLNIATSSIFMSRNPVVAGGTCR